jgi:predicted CXXCH cytochrome family protein
MPENTQKQIAAKYKNDLTYYKKTHPFRRLRFLLALGCLLGGIVWAVGFTKLGGTPAFFNTGPISQNHDRFKNDCAACHTGATTDMLSMFGPGKAHEPSVPLLETLKAAGNDAFEKAKEHIGDPKKLAAATNMALAALNLDNIDAACVRCHKGMALHQPGTKAVMFREGEKELSVVAAAACSSCHREHIGTARMRLPTSETCVDCHGSEAKLAASLQRVNYDGSLAAAHGRNVQWGDVVQWLPPSKVGAKPAIVTAFGKGHPDFLYEDAAAKDGANLRFNHARHVKLNKLTGAFEQAENVGKFNGKVLECSSCHEPDGDGVGMKRIAFDQHCASCHGLSPDADLPGFTIPHHDPVKVRDFLASLYTKWSDYAGKQFNVTDVATLKAFLDQRGERFKQQWGGGLEDVQRRVFFEGAVRTDDDRVHQVPHRHRRKAGAEGRTHEPPRWLAHARPVQARRASSHELHGLPRCRARQRSRNHHDRCERHGPDEGHPASETGDLRGMPQAARLRCGRCESDRSHRAEFRPVQRRRRRAAAPRGRRVRQLPRLPQIPRARVRDGNRRIAAQVGALVRNRRLHVSRRMSDVRSSR